MAGTKTSKVGGKNLKKESKEQKRLRLLAEKESFDQCRKLLPIFGGILLLLILVFSFYVNSIPPAPLQNIEEQKIDLRDFTVEQLEEMVQQSNDEGFASKIEEYKRMLER
ncbi:hypothetical protein TL16_g10731 [Triparma laevis f. inornata]|uniref:Uncharacterized protein n=2 Tax=Triparma laevis TaxID=1534972 RepID=A0A9W6ZBI8_9STRA|nr:hypothetical protein TrLO_g9965 [Triparma laevis f. longispina]GMH87042.1 hypothetical protein TL16_g10731 [Triparma laevis f. inornata]